MSVNNKIHAVQISPVTTLLDHTDVSVRWDLLQTLGLRIQMIQFVLVRTNPDLFADEFSPQVFATSLIFYKGYRIIELHRKKLANFYPSPLRSSLYLLLFHLNLITATAFFISFELEKIRRL